MNEIKKENLEEQSTQDTTEVPNISLSAEQVEEIEKEAEESLEELDKENTDKKHGWGEPVEGEVEIDGEIVKVRYREKVITLPEHRRKETGITRIRRRELLPPLPKGLYLTPEDRIALSKNKGEWYVEKEAKDDSEGKKYLPAYNGAEKFDDVYKLLTNRVYPNPENYAHIVHYIHTYYKSDRKNMMTEKMKSFLENGFYFQKIDKNIGMSFDLYPGHMYQSEYANPVFIFDGREGSALDIKANLRKEEAYLETHGLVKKHEIHINPNEHGSPLRFCDAKCALIPTKRGLNVLFFETGNEDEKDDKIALSTSTSSASSQ